jgi:AcrR family transcriptional regulator
VTRNYRLGRRQPAVDATASSIVTAARQLVQDRPSGQVSVAQIARRAGVSRITVYNRFGSRAGVLRSLAAPAAEEMTAESPRFEGDPRDALRRHLAEACARWAADPALFRNLPPPSPPLPADGRPRLLAERLAAQDALRPGCSLREAEDVIATLGSFAVFDRLHHDGRRPPAAVAEVLMRLAAGILA